MKKKIIVFIHWSNMFITTNEWEAVDEYLNFFGLTLEDFALENCIIEEVSEVLTEEQKDQCYELIFDDIEYGFDDWEIREIEINL